MLSIWWQQVSWSYNVFNGTSMGEGSICLMWQFCLSTIKQHGSTSPFPWWMNKGRGHWNVEFFNGRKICSMFQVEEAPTCIPLTNNTKGYNRSINNDILTLSIGFIALRDWIQLRNKIWTRSGQFSFMKQISLSMLCDIWRF
jgi:hypothetical protein